MDKLIKLKDESEFLNSENKKRSAEIYDIKRLMNLQLKNVLLNTIDNFYVKKGIQEIIKAKIICDYSMGEIINLNKELFSYINCEPVSHIIKHGLSLDMSPTYLLPILIDIFAKELIRKNGDYIFSIEMYFDCFEFYDFNNKITINIKFDKLNNLKSILKIQNWMLYCLYKPKTGLIYLKYKDTYDFMHNVNEYFN